ncbi:myc box-dependent-interacting protein 1 [Diaphorina citri]|uniref:Myc box-dependent-interacting protein 1 n=1 Tax=Diaphorina citri TaxID=121845 RepID=A0A3Q0J8L9_DIACI|nr:myc box-dependent-interacting protein 1 [Diaphorina citri]
MALFSLLCPQLLQNLGKVDRTADEIFDDDLQNFNKQQNAAARLQKEFNNYIRCIRAVQTASKSLLDSINEMYESQWTGHDLFYVQTQNIEMLWNDLSHKLGDQVLIPLNTYQAQFPEMRKKIDKRGRKLVDFDNCRHNLQALQSNASLKKKDEAKIIRAKEQLDEAKRTYDQLNTELHDELPALHESRVLFLVNNLQTLCSAEQLFHAETAKFEQIYDIPSGATTDNLPAGVLYRVKATYKYTREDVDELSFDVGEIIRVVEYDDPEEQEEGWLMGIKESTGEKGMFPANFTRPL